MLLHATCQLGHDTDEEFGKHELPSMMHFVFLHRQHHLETTLTWRFRTGGHTDRFGEEVVGINAEADPLEDFRTTAAIACVEVADLQNRHMTTSVSGPHPWHA